ncbi:unnamed protein product [Adineta steineri]|uniref:LMBR1 domain-containing protein 2-like protein n=1 Tax=Adineta steineri TaxID=433720 RepID=A0A813NA18_9BILA|nr:unnamed protein product [Adineta steineri]CAF3646422.1 unnamed protein product [Adineta steineri]
MSSIALIFDVIFSCLITLTFLYRCGNYRRQHPITTGAVFISWSFSVLFIFLLPLDISLAAYRECQSQNISTISTTTISPDNLNLSNTIEKSCPRPWSYVNPRSYEVLWRIIYWTSQCLTWFILPFMQSICQTGEFYWKGKIRFALRSNLIYYGTLLLIFGILVIYVAVNYNLSASNFKVTVIAASTTWGLFLLVLMLGYGLVEVPLNVYNHSRTSYVLSHIQFNLSKLYNEKIDIEERLESLVEDISKLCLQIKYNDSLRPCLEEIVRIIPEQYSNRVKLTMDDYEDYRATTTTTNNLIDLPTEKQLIKLHGLIKKSKHIHHRVQASWVQMINQAFYLEDILNNENNSNRSFVKQSPLPRSWLRQKLFDEHPVLEWYTFCFLRPWALRFLGVGLGIISLIVIWSEMTFFSTSPVLSIFARIVNAARHHYDYFTIEIFCCLSLAYLCLCAYYTIFRMRIFNYFYLSLYHLTDENSLIFAATFLCRLTAPLSYNFLGMIHMDQVITKKTDRQETVFTTIMGRMSVIPMISRGFNFYFPMLICLLCVGTYFRFGSRCLHIFGVRQFFDDDYVSAEYVEDGKNLMKKERRNLGGIDNVTTMANTTTATQRRDRRRELEEKYGLRSTSTNSKSSKLPSDDLAEIISESRQLKASSSSSDEPLIMNNNNHNQRVPPSATTASGSSRRVAPPTNIFNDI